MKVFVSFVCQQFEQPRYLVIPALHDKFSDLQRDSVMFQLLSLAVQPGKKLSPFEASSGFILFYQMLQANSA
jgi:hypothetical protein